MKAKYKVGDEVCSVWNSNRIYTIVEVSNKMFTDQGVGIGYRLADPATTHAGWLAEDEVMLKVIRNFKRELIKLLQ